LLGERRQRSAKTVQVKKAIITAAGKHQRTLPLQTLIDRDGQPKSALRILLEEVLAAGIEEVCLVVAPGDRKAYREAAEEHAARLHFVEQSQPLGYGHAVACARTFAADEPFLLMVGDHLYVSNTDQRCAAQLVALASDENSPVSAVQATHESKLPLYGAVGGKLVHARKGVYEIEAVIEKPTPTEAEQRLVVPGLRAGYYLCFFGMHVLTPAAMAILGEMLQESPEPTAVQLSRALAQLAARERYLAGELDGRRYDIGVRYGLFLAQLALAVEGRDREEVLTSLVELLAARR
jgi:UTP--glucose-1-phosphate uridylyltransferase